MGKTEIRVESVDSFFARGRKHAKAEDRGDRSPRSRSAVTRDVQILERFGVLQVTEKILPGHGRQKWVPL